MPDFFVNSEGVSFAMSFIWGLSTMATLTAPLPDPLSSSPPQPATTSPKNSAAINVARTVPLMALLLRGRGANEVVPVRFPYTLTYVGCQGGDREFPNIKPTLALCF